MHCQLQETPITEDISMVLLDIPIKPEVIYIRPITPKNCEIYRNMQLEMLADAPEFIEDLSKCGWAFIKYNNEWHNFGEFPKEVEQDWIEAKCVIIKEDYKKDPTGEVLS